MAGDARATVYGDFSADFVEERLANLCDPNDGVQTGPFGSQLHQKDYVPAGTPIITVEHLGENRILHQDVPRVSDKDKERLSKYALRTGDIVFSRVGSVDRRALVREAEDGWLFSGRCLRVRPDPDKIDPGYLSYFFGLASFREHIRAIAVGATMPSLNTEILSNVVVPHPPDLSEQRAIAHILGTLDDKIELNRRMNETLEAMARALFKSWFVDFLPVRAKMAARTQTGDPLPASAGQAGVRAKCKGVINHAFTQWPREILDLFPDSFEDSELGEIPKGWEVWRVADVGDIICGKTPSTKVPEYYGDDVPFITIPDMHGKLFATTTQKKLSRVGAASQHKKMLPAGSICVSCIATPGLVVITMEEAQTNQQINTIVPSKANETCFWFWSLRDLGGDIRAGGSGGSVLTNLSTGRFAELRVLAPPARLRCSYHSLVSSIFDRILANEKEASTLVGLRDALLPKLISGELRVNDLERVIAGVSA